MATSISLSRLVVLLVAVDVSLALVSPFSTACRRWTPSTHSLCLKQDTTMVRYRFDTSLHMGIRSFIQNRIVNRSAGGGEESNNSEEVDESSGTMAELQIKDVEKRDTIVSDTEKENSMDDQTSGTDRSETSQERNRPETPQERIQRVKSGKMTDEEKLAFVSVALSAGETKSRMPLRQSIPTNLDGTGRGRRRSSASPFPKDSILRDVIFGRGKESDPSVIRQSMAAKELMDSQKKKRDYFDMVTNPNRFKTYKSTPEAEADAAFGPDSSFSDDILEPTDSDGEPNTEQLIELAVVEDALIETLPLDPEDSETTVLEASDIINAPADLGKRLEAAAVIDEERRKIARVQLDQQRMDEDLRKAEVRRKREEEQNLREADALAKKKEQTAAAALAADERRQTEEARQAAIIAAQDDYWKKKLGKDRGVAPESEETNYAARSEDESVDGGIDGISEDPKPSYQGFDEDTVLAGLASLNDVKRIKKPPQGAKGGSRSAFLAEQAKKKAEIDKAKQDQLVKLRALNSPLPSGRPVGISPTTPSIKKFAPIAVPVPRPASPPSSPPRSLADLSRILNPGNGQSVPLSSEPEVSSPARTPTTNKPFEPSMTIKDILRQRAVETASVKGSSSASPSKSPAPQPPVLAPPAPQPLAPAKVANSVSGGGLGALGRLLGGPVPRKDATEQKRVVRQELPTADIECDDNNEDDEFEAFSRNGPNKGMSIGDAMSSKTLKPADKAEQKERSKMWGIDISKYSD